MLPPLILAGLGFGDEGKGTCVDALAAHFGYQMVVRYNGGCQAGHNVVMDDGRHHCFSQFGAASFIPGVETFLSRFMLVDLVALENEEDHLQSVDVFDAFKRLYVDERALVITPYHRMVNKLREQERGDARHGSCGMGVGETVLFAIENPISAMRMSDILGGHRFITERLCFIRDRLCEKYYKFREKLWDLPATDIASHMLAVSEKFKTAGPGKAKMLLRQEGLIFEGAQGILLDEDFGFHPHTTWSRTTTANAVALLRESDNAAKPFRVGVSRTFMTRHGAGPFPTEDENYEGLLRHDHNTGGEYQGALRVGHLDTGLLDKAIAFNGGFDAIALTHCDKSHIYELSSIGGAFRELPRLLLSSGQKRKDKEIFDILK